MRQHVVIPVYWGESFLPTNAQSFSWLDMNGAIQEIMNGPFVNGMVEYGVGPSVFHPTADVAPGELPVGATFTNDQVTKLLVGEIDAGRAPRPDDFSAGLIPFYFVFLRRGLFSGDHPNDVGFHYTFTYQNNVSPCAWVMQGADLDGTTPIFTHEFAEGACLVEVGDPCNGQNVRIGHFLVEKYFSNVFNSCIDPSQLGWHDWSRIGNPQSNFNMSTPVTALVGPTGHLDVFAVGTDGGVWTIFWDGQWHDWSRIGNPQNSFNMRAPVAAVVGPTKHLDVFAVGTDGGVWTTFWGRL